jgi:hypothetical protein
MLQMSRTVLLQHVSGKAAFVHTVFGLKQFIGKIGARTYQPVRARFISNFLPLHSRFLCSTNMRKCRVLLVRVGFKSCRNVNAHKPNLDHSDNFALSQHPSHHQSLTKFLSVHSNKNHTLLAAAQHQAA